MINIPFSVFLNLGSEFRDFIFYFVNIRLVAASGFCNCLLHYSLSTSCCFLQLCTCTKKLFTPCYQRPENNIMSKSSTIGATELLDINCVMEFLLWSQAIHARTMTLVEGPVLWMVSIPISVPVSIQGSVPVFSDSWWSSSSRSRCWPLGGNVAHLILKWLDFPENETKQRFYHNNIMSR